MAKTFLVSFIFSVIFSIHCAYAQSPVPAPPAPAPSPSNITAVLEKAGQYNTFMKLLQSTQEDTRINSQIGSSSTQGMTVFAPTDNAFTSLKTGTLNSLSDQDKIQLVQFHVLPSLYTMSQFQTVSNPLRTEAGNSTTFPLNVTTTGNNQVNVSTGVNTATVSNSILSSSKLAVYQVDQVLQPLALFGTPAPAPAPTAEKVAPAAAPKTSASSDTPADNSGAASLNHFAVVMGILGFAAYFF